MDSQKMVHELKDVLDKRASEFDLEPKSEKDRNNDNYDGNNNTIDDKNRPGNNSVDVNNNDIYDTKSNPDSNSDNRDHN